jgi:hypothetical protein
VNAANVTDVEILCTGPLALIDTIPEDGDRQVSRAIQPILSFSADVDSASAIVPNITLASDVGETAFAIDVSGSEVTLSPDLALLPLTEYTLDITTDVTGSNGERLEEARSLEFKTRDGAWGADIAIDSASGTPADAQIGFDADGNALAIWYQEVNNGTNLWSNYYAAGTGWGTAELVEHNDVDKYAGSPRFEFDANGNALAVWTQTAGMSGGNVWSAVYEPGSGWTTPETIENDPGDVIGVVEMAGTRDGAAIAVWAQFDGVTINTWANNYVPGSGWGTPVIVDDATLQTSSPRVAVDADGNALAAWVQYDGGIHYNIWAARYVKSSGWESPVLVSTENSKIATDHRLAFDVDGNALMIFAQDEGFDRQLQAARFTPAGGWSKPELISPALEGLVEYPDIAFAADASALAVWEQPVRVGGQVLILAYSNRYVPGSGWGTAEPLNDSDAFYPKVGIDASGNALAVWHELDLGRPYADAYSVWGNRRVAGGNWSSPERIGSYGNLVGTFLPNLAIAPNGDAFAIWTRPGHAATAASYAEDIASTPRNTDSMCCASPACFLTPATTAALIAWRRNWAMAPRTNIQRRRCANLSRWAT